MHMRAWVGLPDGSAWLSDAHSGSSSAPETLGEAVAQRLTLAGAGEILRDALQMSAAAG
jgi:hypothetical protein